MFGVSRFNISVLRKFNVWYTTKDGNWDDPTIWRSNGAKKHSLPQPGDDVHIEHTVAWNYNFPVNVHTNSIKDLYISGKLICNPGLNQTSLNVSNIFCSGILDLSGSSGGGGFMLNISGDKSYFANFVQGNPTSNITIKYTGANNFVLPDIPYYNLSFSGVKTIWLASNLTLPGSLTMDTTGSVLELGNYDFSVGTYNGNGVTNPTLSKTGPGTVNFTGANHNMSGYISFTGNPTINVYGSFNGLSRSTGTFNFGTGTLNVLNNSSWSFSSGGNVPFSLGVGLNVLIAAGKTLTYSGIAPWQNDGTINGASSTSTFNVSTGYWYGNTNTPMTTGVFNYNFSGTSTIGYRNGVSNTLPQTAYYGLQIDTGSTAVLSGNTTIGNLTANGVFQASVYNLTVSSTTSYGGQVLKSGAGTVNLATIIESGQSTGKIDFSAGNPTVNLSGNISGNISAGLNFGSNVVNITANLSFNLNYSGNIPAPITNSFLIASGKTLTLNYFSATNGGLDLTGTIDGVDTTAILDNKTRFIYRGATAPMLNGKLYANQAANKVEYSAAGNQDIKTPDDPTPGYKDLTLNNSGVKRLLGNVSVKGVYTLTPPATLNSNGFTLSNP